MSVPFKPKFHYTDTDQTGPDPTRPDPTRLYCDLVSDKSGPYQIPLYGPDPTAQIGDLSRDVARPINPTINPTSFNKMENVTMSGEKILLRLALEQLHVV